MKRKKLFIALGVTMLLSCIVAFISCKPDNDSSLDNKTVAGTWLMYDQGSCKQLAVLNSNGRGCTYFNCDGYIDYVDYFTYSYNASKHTMTISFYDSYYGYRYSYELYISWKSDDCVMASYTDEYYGVETMELIRVSRNQDVDIEDEDYYDYYDDYGYDDWYYYTNARK